MTTTRLFHCKDLLKITNTNLDFYTETFSFSFYFEYLCKWPEYCFVSEDSLGRVQGYHLGRTQGTDEKYRGHLSAITLNRESRRTGLSGQMLHWLKSVSEEFGLLSCIALDTNSIENIVIMLIYLFEKQIM